LPVCPKIEEREKANHPVRKFTDTNLEYNPDPMQETFSLVDHPLVQHKLTLMRDKDCPTANFRQLIREIALLLAYEVTRDLPLGQTQVETPLETMDAPILAGKKLCFISVLRAGNGLLEGMLDLIPSARVGHIGLYRDPDTLQAVEYYYKVPEDISERQAIVVDPMLATANSLSAAVTRLKQDRPVKIKVVCLLAAPEGVAAFGEAHPDVPVYSAALDRELNDHGYILPGLGDAGDRIYGTR
jgi:uracil phosphoribosyltransferase